MKMRSAKGFTLIELLIVVAIIGIIAAIAVPGLLRARMSGNEASAIGSLRAINSGEAAFSSSCANGFYATSLLDLATAPTGGSGFVSPDLKPSSGATVTKSGYNVGLGNGGSSTAASTAACNGVAATNLLSAYAAFATPTSVGGTGTRYFGTDVRGTIFQSTSAAFVDTAMMPSGSTPIQ